MSQPLNKRLMTNHHLTSQQFKDHLAIADYTMRHLNQPYSIYTVVLPSHTTAMITIHPPHTRTVYTQWCYPAILQVSNVLLKHDNEIETKVSLMHFQWGQFLDHDITLIPTNPNSVEAGGEPSFPPTPTLNKVNRFIQI